MGDVIHCECGAVLVEEVTDEGVTPVGGEPIRFRRETDYVICSNCHNVYKARMLFDGRSLADSLVSEGSGETEDDIAKLERLVEGE